MRSQAIAALVSLTLAACSALQGPPAAPEPWYPATSENGDPVFAVFESRIPCADCERITVALVLYRDRQTQAPTMYKLARVYVAKSPEDRIVSGGTWSVARGTKLDPRATVYQLDSNAPREFQFYWAIGQDILFILDPALSPKVGTAGYGYALNRTR
jgi:hypothetical protein